MIRVFVYGSLRRGEPNHRLLGRAHYVGTCRTASGFVLIDLGYFPGMIASGTAEVSGELYDVDTATLAALDRLEGHPRFYQRRLIRLEDGAEASAYVLDPSYMEGRPIVESGDWKRRDREDRNA